MAAGLYNIKIEQGANWSLSLVWKDSSGQPIDLTGYTARMQIRKVYKDPTVKLSLTSASGIELGGPAGTILLTATKSQTSAISVDYVSFSWNGDRQAQRMVYDLEVESGTGISIRLLQGVAFIYPEVTS